MRKQKAWAVKIALTIWLPLQGGSLAHAQAPASPPGAGPTELPPSSVSASIERFVKEHEKELAASSPAQAQAQARGGAASALPAPSRSVSNPRPNPNPGPAPVAVPASAPGPARIPAPARTAAPIVSANRLSPPRDDTSPAFGTPRPGEAARPARVAQAEADPSARAGAIPPMLSSTSPLDRGSSLSMKSAPFESVDRRFPINLATALRLSDARPLVVAAAQAGVWVAEAQLTRSKVLWIPMLNFGFDYIRHDGGGPDINKGIMTAPSYNYFMGGAGASLNLNLTDSYYRPLAARQVLNARHWEVQTAKNDVLQETADAYFRVHQARGMYAGALYAVERGHVLIDKITDLSKEFVPRVEVDRVQNMVADLEQRATSARENWRVASADLSQVLRLDPRAVVEPLEHDHAQITLIDPGRALDDMIPVALANRPELASYRALVEVAEIGVRREKARPLLPVVMINGLQHAGMLMQFGIFGLGPNASLDQWRGRGDVSYQLVWQLENFGAGNLAKIKHQRGEQSQAIIDLRRAQDRVAADVTRALARVQASAPRIVQADRALRTALVTFNGHLEGLGQTRRLGNVLILTYRPQEAVYSLEQLNVSFNEYFTTVAEYNRAQFELFHALGYPAQEVTSTRSTGEILPVDIARPAYLPPVGNGPPPATR